MKQLVIISGKGGTGKSTIAASFAEIVKNKMIADCDVDAPNLHILLGGKKVSEEIFKGAKEAVIDQAKCLKCGLCRDVCRFDAISDEIEIISLKCEGCGACIQVCPINAIKLEEVKTGYTYLSETSCGKFSHALLDAGAEGSGKLVTAVRKKADENAENEDYLIIDGSPGIGCVVIASLTGTDAALIVTEPTQSGLSDLQRALDLTEHFKIKTYICVNKYDINSEITKEIEAYCNKRNYEVIGKIPFDPRIVDDLREMRTPISSGNVAFTNVINQMWDRIRADI